MTNSAKRDKKVQRKGRFDIGGLIIKQIIATAICFAFVLGMQNCQNSVISSYADALGRALKHNTDWKYSVDSVGKWIKEQFKISESAPADEQSNYQALPNSTQEITFQ